MMRWLAGLVTTLLPAAAAADIVLGTVLQDPFPCASGEEFTVRIFLDTEREDLRSVSSGFTYNANRYEYVSTDAAPGFEGNANGTALEVFNIGTYTFTIGASSDEEFLPPMFLADVTFRTKESNLTGRTFTNEPPTDPLFVREGGSTFTRPFDLSRTESITCGQGGLVETGGVTVRSELAEGATCGAAGTFRVRLSLDTESPFVHSVSLTALYDQENFRLADTIFLEDYGPVDGSVQPADPFDPGQEVEISLRRPDGKGMLAPGSFLELHFEAREQLAEGESHPVLRAEEDSVRYGFQGMEELDGEEDFSATEEVFCTQAPESQPTGWFFY